MNRTATGLRPADIFSPTVAALISVLVNYGGTFILVFQAAELARLTPAQTTSWAVSYTHLTLPTKRIV